MPVLIFHKNGIRGQLSLNTLFFLDFWDQSQKTRFFFWIFENSENKMPVLTLHKHKTRVNFL